jgi:hypothetical protein
MLMYMELTTTQIFELERFKRDLKGLTNEQLREISVELLSQTMMLRNFVNYTVSTSEGQTDQTK